jgi:hypothetical protein
MVRTVITASGTYTKPADLKYLEVWCVGGGGGSSQAPATAASQASSGVGGGGGGAVWKLYRASDLAATEAYTVGPGGTSPGGAGAAGGSSTFKGLTAGGGGGGGAPATAVGTFLGLSLSVGGTATGGDLNVGGGRSWQGCANFPSVGYAISGGGGGSQFAPPFSMGIHNGKAVGQPGFFPGGGAAGASNGQTQTLSAGANGGDGCIILTEYF